MDELFDTNLYTSPPKYQHPDDVDIYPELMSSPVEEESVHPLYSSDTTGEPTGELAHGGNYPEIYQWTETYERRSNTYVRYCYSANKVVGVKKTIHIPGGNIHNPRTKERWIKVEQMIQRGKQPEEISGAIALWR
jgi:hypothetical protein